VAYSENFNTDDASGMGRRETMCFLENEQYLEYDENYCPCVFPDECRAVYDDAAYEEYYGDDGSDGEDSGDSLFSDMETFLKLGVDPVCSFMGSDEPEDPVEFEAVLSTLPFTFDVECIPAMEAISNLAEDSGMEDLFGGDWYANGPATCDSRGNSGDGGDESGSSDMNIAEICGGKCGPQVAQLAELQRYCFGEVMSVMADMMSEEEVGMLAFVLILSVGPLVHAETACVPDGNGGFCADYDGPLSVDLIGENEFSGDVCAEYAGNCCATAMSEVNLLALLPLLKMTMGAAEERKLTTVETGARVTSWGGGKEGGRERGGALAWLVGQSLQSQNDPISLSLHLARRGQQMA
jgi:hypothetical protein